MGMMVSEGSLEGFQEGSGPAEGSQTLLGNSGGHPRGRQSAPGGRVMGEPDPGKLGAALKTWKDIHFNSPGPICKHWVGFGTEE